MADSAGDAVKLKLKPRHPLEWLLEPLEEHPGYLRKKMFGCESAYINGRLTVVLAAGDEPWNGILVPTNREYHSALQKLHTGLKPHPVLGKWLYLSQSDPNFEEIAIAIIERVLHEDPLIGVEPKPRKRRSSVIIGTKLK